MTQGLHALMTNDCAVSGAGATLCWSRLPPILTLVSNGQQERAAVAAGSTDQR